MSGTGHEQHEAPATLRWKLFGAVAIVVVGVAALSLLLARDAVRGFVRLDEIERLREGPVVELKQRCLNYLTDRDRHSVEKLMASLVAKHDQLAYVCFIDPDLVGRDSGEAGLLSSMATPPAELLALAQDATAVPDEGRTRRVGGERVVDVTATTATRPAYTLHLGLRAAAIEGRIRSLFTKMTLIAAVIAGGGLAVAFGLIVLVTSPLQTLATNASRLSLGDMRVTFNPRGRGELSWLAEALDRLKESVLCALKRSGPRPHTPMRGGRMSETPVDDDAVRAGKK
jgi:HAMP domain-containing protein